MSGGGSVRTTYKGKATFDDIMSQAALYLGISFMVLVLLYNIVSTRAMNAPSTPSSPVTVNTPVNPAANNTASNNAAVNNAPASNNSPASNNGAANTPAANSPAANTPAANNAPAGNAPVGNNAPK